ncbi:MAG: serine/threonine-protein kinase [Myxococcota bacterium]
MRPAVELAAPVSEESAISRDLSEVVDIGPLLGRGGMAEVYEAVDRASGAAVALKRLVPNLAVRTNLRLRFANEIDLLERCRGPYVLALHANGTWDNTPAYVCERCVGSLYDLGRDRVLPLPRVLRLMSEVLAALDRVHAAGAVHRDIKPSNVLLAADGTVRLADFGIARHPNRRLTAVGHTVGTPCYAAPDLAANPRAAEPAHDLFSVGLLILALSTHLRPRVLTDPAERQRTLDRFPAATARLLDRATAANPAARYPSAAEMALDVQRALVEPALP